MKNQKNGCDMSFLEAIKILESTNHEIIKHDGWGSYEILDEFGDSVGYGCQTFEEEELIEYVKDYLL